MQPAQRPLDRTRCAGARPLGDARPARGIVQYAGTLEEQTVALLGEGQSVCIKVARITSGTDQVTHKETSSWDYLTARKRWFSAWQTITPSPGASPGRCTGREPW